MKDCMTEPPNNNQVLSLGEITEINNTSTRLFMFKVNLVNNFHPDGYTKLSDLVSQQQLLKWS